jgi:anti-sigma regulatory factor (Ser/Thr protein kinase)
VLERGFRHEALFYSGEESFLAGTLPFIREAVAAGEPIMVAVSPSKIELLKSRLNGSADVVTFADMYELGRNPALIIPAWQDFVAQNTAGGRRVHGIGEPIWAERSAAELVECRHHESLLNLAFDGGPDWRLLCPYDTDALEPSVLEGAEQNHRLIAERGSERPSHAYREPEATHAPFVGPLPPPPVAPDEFAFASPADLEPARQFVAEQAAGEGADPRRADGLVLAVDEVVTNTLRHGGGRGLLRVWSEDGDLVCEVSDSGTISDRLVGRVRPLLDQPNGRGLWIANHFCDLVQIRSSDAGTVVRCRIGDAVSAVTA